MQIANTTIVLIAAVALLAAGNFYLTTQVIDLKQEVKTVSEIADKNFKQVEELKVEFLNIKALETQRSDARQTRDKSDAKMRKDSKRENVVAAKPKLVENKINESFDSFAKSLQDATK